jgi:cytochrome c-type biogenesis protein CcmF
VVTCVGTISTAISDAIFGRRIVVGPAFYNHALIPTGLLLLVTTAVAPLLNWGNAPTPLQKRMLWISSGVGSVVVVMALLCGVRHPILLVVGGLSAFAIVALAGSILIHVRRQPSGNFGRDLLETLRDGRRQYAGFLIHMGLFCLALGVAGSSLGTQRHETIMRRGETIEWAGRRVRLVQITQREFPDKLVAEAHLEIRKGLARPCKLIPAQHYHLLQKEWTSEVDIQSTWTGDLYSILHSGEGEGRVRLTLVENPMMRWIWLGGWMMGAGSIIALWPATRSSRFPSTSSRRQTTAHRRPSSAREKPALQPALQASNE